MSPDRFKPSLAFVGLGYVGLATAACLASRGFRVLGIDIDEGKLAVIRRGTQPIHEKGLGPLLRTSLRRKTLNLASSYEQVAESDIIFITVGTPSKADGSIDTHFVVSAAEGIGRRLASARGYHLVVVKSTVIPGTTTGLVLPTLERESGMGVGTEFGLAMNPEFLHEGSAVDETLHPDGLVVGGFDKRSSGSLLEMYRAFYGRLPPVIQTSLSNAEMMKYAINTARAAQVSMVNTIANLCSLVPDCDYDDVRKGMSLIARMDERYLAAGLGFGGSCLPKDARALAAFARSFGINDGPISVALDVNEQQVDRAIHMAEELVGSMAGKRVSILGLAFKAETDDIRESVSIRLAQALVGRGVGVSVYDPKAMENARGTLGGSVEYAKTAKDCLRGSDCCFIATGWSEFKKLRPADFRKWMAIPVVVDGRRVYDQNLLRKGGVLTATIGIGPTARSVNAPLAN